MIVRMPCVWYEKYFSRYFFLSSSIMSIRRPFFFPREPLYQLENLGTGVLVGRFTKEKPTHKKNRGKEGRKREKEERKILGATDVKKETFTRGEKKNPHSVKN